MRVSHIVGDAAFTSSEFFDESLSLDCSTAKAWLGFTEGPCHDLNLVRSYALFAEKQVSSEIGIQASLAALSGKRPNHR